MNTTKQYETLFSSEKKVVDELFNKIRVKFCCNPNEININPNKILYISSFIFKELKTCYQYKCHYTELCRLILERLIEYYPENIFHKENVYYFIKFQLEDFYRVLNNLE